MIIAEFGLRNAEWEMKTENGIVVDMDIQKIPLAQIDLLDETFSVNYFPDLQKLRSSIQETG